MANKIQAKIDKLVSSHDKRRYTKFLQKIETLDRDARWREFWKQIKGTHSDQDSMYVVRNPETGQLTTNRKEFISCWETYFSKLLGKTKDNGQQRYQPVEDAIIDRDLSAWELEQQIDKLKLGKAPGFDQVCPQTAP